MKLVDLAVQYRESEKQLEIRVNELKDEYYTEKMTLTERYRLAARINRLNGMKREVGATAHQMEHYYDRSRRRAR